MRNVLTLSWSFFLTQQFDLPHPQQPTMMGEENCGGELEKAICDLAIRPVLKKYIILFLNSNNCHWHFTSLDWYYNDYYYKCIKYILYYESLRFTKFSTEYKVILADITNGSFSKNTLLLPATPGGTILNYFEHSFLDLPKRSRRLQSVLYVATNIDIDSLETCVRNNDNQLGVLVSPLLIQRFCEDAKKTKVFVQ